MAIKTVCGKDDARIRQRKDWEHKKAGSCPGSELPVTEFREGIANGWFENTSASTVAMNPRTPADGPQLAKSSAVALTRWPSLPSIASPSVTSSHGPSYLRRRRENHAIGVGWAFILINTRPRSLGDFRRFEIEFGLDREEIVFSQFRRTRHQFQLNFPELFRRGVLRDFRRAACEVVVR
ncbi:hypothetical protein NKJ46_27435 [Mesorhizobium sp. M0166]|uniref:hypothetical protein n=1 Tax=Mesorhizobium sp. M0166 TaxID=2956902 RepID=UPI00333502DC